MLRNLYFLLSVLFIFASCKTQKEAQIISTSGAPTLENSLLWEISGNGLEESSYLFGTIHLIDEKDFFWPSNCLTAFDSSEEIFFEIDMDDMTDMSKQMALLPKLIMTDGSTLKDFYNEADYSKVKEHFADLGLPMFFLEKMKPMFLMVFASGDLEFGGSLEDSSMKSYEMELYALANQSNKEVSGVETIEDQISVFDSIPYQEQADMLLETINTSEDSEGMMAELIKMYKEQNITALSASMEEDESIDKYSDILNSDRNQNWIPIMAENMLERKCFFAVGAGHLAGKKGVISLLMKEGYSVKAYSTSN